VTTDGAQASVVARLPGAAALGLLAPPGAVAVPGAQLADPDWTAEVLAARARRQRTDDRRVLATLWWYSASSVLVTPVLAGLVTGVRLSARLADTSVHLLPGHTPIAATAAAGSGDDVAGELRGSLAAVVAAVAEAGGMRERPLWAIATDSLANRLLSLGRAVGDVGAVTALARPLAAAVGEPLPAPRYVDVSTPSGDAVRFTRRTSCCLLDQVPHEVRCTSCPHRTPFERQVLLEDAAAR
jgi:ferric iron reductase protein FhuF